MVPVRAMLLLLVVACQPKAPSAGPPPTDSQETGHPDTGSAGGTATPVTCGESGSYIDLKIDDDIVDIADCTHILGTLRFGDTDFVSFEGLESLDTIDETLILFRNLDLTAIRGLSGLERVGGAVSVRLHSRLGSVAGFESLARAGSLEIENNDVLSSLDGLSGLESLDGDLSIRYNPLLSQAEAEAFAERVEVGGTIQVEGNGARR